MIANVVLHHALAGLGIDAGDSPRRRVSTEEALLWSYPGDALTFFAKDVLQHLNLFCVFVILLIA